MHFATILKITAASTLLLAASTASGATYTFNVASGDWNTIANWTWDGGGSPSVLPGLADNVVIPTAKVAQVTNSVSSVDALANSVDVQGTGQIVITDNALQVDGGLNSTIASTNGIKLDGNGATLYLSASQTFSGAGSIQMDDVTALMDIASGATITFSVQVHGFGSISANSGTATLFNQHSVVADSPGNTLELAADLILDDQDGSPDSLWKATGADAKLQFKRDATLDGDVTQESGGDLDFQANLSFTHTDSVYTRGTGTLMVAAGKTFSWYTFTGVGGCGNPDTDGVGCDPGTDPPEEICGGQAGYSSTCS